MSVDVLLSNENLSIFGGPASLDINVDYGAPGIRGSLIFFGAGKPTDPSVTFSTTPLPQDLYINRKPSDFEYLFLYEYNYVNGVLGWSKVIRLIPNTALANIPIVFIDGIARTIQPTAAAISYIASLPATVPPQSAADIFEDILAITVTTEPETPLPGMFWLDFGEMPSPILKFYNGVIWVDFATILDKLYFPITDYFSEDELSLGEESGFNVQYVILNNTPIASGLTVEPLTTIGSKVYLPVNITATETEPFTPGGDVVWQKINGVRILSFVLVAGVGSLPLF